MAISGKELGQQRALPFSRITEQTTAQYAFSEGVTKRELFAGLALMGILANQHYDPPRRTKFEGIAEDAAHAADALCAELAKDGAP